MKNHVNVAIIGATGIVGSTLLDILSQRHFPLSDLFLLASERSAGEMREFNGKSYRIQNISQFDFSQTQIAFFCANNDIAAEYAQKAADNGNIVIDKSSYFRNDKTIPLVVPEVNPEALSMIKNQGIIASPNCNTIPIVFALKPIYDAVGITRINVATYQSVSGTGKDAINELAKQTAQLLNGKPIKPHIYPQQIAFNLLPHINDFLENGYTEEEMKIVWETQKIFNDKELQINPTTVRVPVFYGHSAALHIETRRKLTADAALNLLKNFKGLVVNTGKYPYATPAKDAAGKDEVFVGRVREDISHSNGLNLWVVSDNIRKGAALNAVHIAEFLLNRKEAAFAR